MQLLDLLNNFNINTNYYINGAVMNHIKPMHQKQRGSTLLITLVILLLITIATLSLFSNSIVEQKSTANYVDSNHAYQEAESQLFALLAAPRGRWGSLVPRSSLAPAAIIPSYSNGGDPDLSSTITMKYIATLPSKVKDAPAESETGIVEIEYESISRAAFGRARAAHKMITKAEMPPQTQTDPCAVDPTSCS